MQFHAKLNNLRQSPRKVRKIADLVRGLDVVDARAQLTHVPQRSSEAVLKLLNSAIANAENNFDADEQNLFIKTVMINEGPTLKRYRPRAHGRAYQILKRTSKIELTLEEKKPTKKREAKKQEAKEETINLADFTKKEAEEKEEAAKNNEKDKKATPDAKKPHNDNGKISSEAKGNKPSIFRRKGDA